MGGKVCAAQTRHELYPAQAGHLAAESAGTWESHTGHVPHGGDRARNLLPGCAACCSHKRRGLPEAPRGGYGQLCCLWHLGTVCMLPMSALSKVEAHSHTQHTAPWSSAHCSMHPGYGMAHSPCMRMMCVTKAH